MTGRFSEGTDSVHFFVLTESLMIPGSKELFGKHLVKGEEFSDQKENYSEHHAARSCVVARGDSQRGRQGQYPCMLQVSETSLAGSHGSSAPNGLR